MATAPRLAAPGAPADGDADPAGRGRHRRLHHVGDRTVGEQELLRDRHVRHDLTTSSALPRLLDLRAPVTFEADGEAFSGDGHAGQPGSLRQRRHTGRRRRIGHEPATAVDVRDAHGDHVRPCGQDTRGDAVLPRQVARRHGGADANTVDVGDIGIVHDPQPDLRWPACGVRRHVDRPPEPDRADVIADGGLAPDLRGRDNFPVCIRERGRRPVHATAPLPARTANRDLHHLGNADLVCVRFQEAFLVPGRGDPDRLRQPLILHDRLILAGTIDFATGFDGRRHPREREQRVQPHVQILVGERASRERRRDRLLRRRQHRQRCLAHAGGRV